MHREGFGTPRFNHTVSPSLKCLIERWHVVIAGTGRGDARLLHAHDPQIPSRQSWSKATGSIISSTKLLVEGIKHLKDDIPARHHPSVYVTKIPLSLILLAPISLMSVSCQLYLFLYESLAGFFPAGLAVLQVFISKTDLHDLHDLQRLFI